MSVPNWVFSMFAFIGFLCCAIPFRWHLEAWNTGTCLYMFWVGIGCLFQFINSIVWNGNAINWAPVWCDISSRFMIGCNWAVPAASLCINRRLYHIASVQSVTISKAEKRRAIMVDLGIGLGLPILGMILQYIPQGHRFNIWGDIGCFPYTYYTPVAIVLVSLPPIIIGLVSLVYCVLSIRKFKKRHAQFAELLSGHSNLSSNRYLRLMALASTDVLMVVPLGCWALALNIKGGIHPWLGWEDTHQGFSRVDQIPSMIWRLSPSNEFSLEFTRWIIVVCALVFFGFFGFADEALKNYRSAASTVAKKVGYSSTFSSTSTATASTGDFNSKGGKSTGGNSSVGKMRPVPPVMVHTDMLTRQLSIDSFTDASLNINDVGGFLEDEKKDYSPTASYAQFTLNDVGGTLADYSSDNISPTPSSGSSSASSVLSSPISPARESDKSAV
ncbi:pheromone B alpha 1 receptor [Coprinopsis sp. MPI-PUGE-AT-0042]|nr:pheromone B alpha 1 receptor [Coprinopsis sp. MPI-PUGE-AT-0042]